MINVIETVQWEVVLLALTALAVLAGSLVPHRWLPRLPNDKFLHFSAYAFLALFIGRIANTLYELGIGLAILFCAGWLIEVLQNLLPDRRFCWRDILANTAGIALAALFSPQLGLLHRFQHFFLDGQVY